MSIGKSKVFGEWLIGDFFNIKNQYLLRLQALFSSKCQLKEYIFTRQTDIKKLFANPSVRILKVRMVMKQLLVFKILQFQPHFPTQILTCFLPTTLYLKTAQFCKMCRFHRVLVWCSNQNHNGAVFQLKKCSHSWIISFFKLRVPCNYRLDFVPRSLSRKIVNCSTVLKSATSMTIVCVDFITLRQIAKVFFWNTSNFGFEDCAY